MTRTERLHDLARREAARGLTLAEFLRKYPDRREEPRLLSDVATEALELVAIFTSPHTTPDPSGG